MDKKMIEWSLIRDRKRTSDREDMKWDQKMNTGTTRMIGGFG